MNFEDLKILHQARSLVFFMRRLIDFSSKADEPETWMVPILIFSPLSMSMLTPAAFSKMLSGVLEMLTVASK